MILLGSCNAATSRLLKTLDQLNYQLPSGYSGYLLIIPADGCHACKDKGIAFSKAHLKQDNIRFVLTAQNSLKEGILHYSEAELASHYLLLDRKGAFVQEGYIKGYLYLITLKEGKVVHEETIDFAQVDAELAQLRREMLISQK